MYYRFIYCDFLFKRTQTHEEFLRVTHTIATILLCVMHDFHRLHKMLFAYTSTVLVDCIINDITVLF